MGQTPTSPSETPSRSPTAAAGNKCLLLAEDASQMLSNALQEAGELTAARTEIKGETADEH